MTVFLATLFLPYTADINPEKTHSSSPQAASQAKNEVTESVTPLHAPWADNLGQETTQPGLTPGATTNHELIFSASFEEAGVERSGYPFPPTSTLGNRLIESEPHPPAWGAATSLHKPKPQADLSSSASVLKHADPVLLGREPVSQETSSKQPRPSSRRSSSSGVEWTIMTSYHGNGGLFNAVRSAKESGHLEELCRLAPFWLSCRSASSGSGQTTEPVDQPVDSHGGASAFIDDYFRWRVGSSAEENLAKIQSEDVPRIEEWARRTGSCFAAEKTELIHITRKRGEHLEGQITCDGANVKPSPTAKLLGVVFDQGLPPWGG
ncbi:hypothetical protein VN97_g11822 [Penicillium thymicola]|uniref:Uncharacterized protein n=1 Tax=Penicillium thymicola TaxID=293382 RepID=A0AAI9X2V6_PENTH|nr:hypothetical protein VN97_g11822 [Penicillium thymicola]